MTRTRHVRLCALITSFTLAGFAGAQSQDAASLRERLHHAEALTSLDDAVLKPWHLKLSFQLYNRKGAPAEAGTLEQWWSAPDRSKTSISSPSLNGSEFHTSAQLLVMPGADPLPYVLELLLTEIQHPLPPPAEIDGSSPQSKQQVYGAATLSCIMVDKPLPDGTRTPFGLFATYCLSERDVPQVVAPDGVHLITRSRFGSFRGRIVPLSLRISRDTVDVATATVTNLDSSELPEVDREPPALWRTPGDPRNGEYLPGGILYEAPLTTPVRPDGTRKVGEVTVEMLISTDGIPESVRAVSPSAGDLAMAAVACARELRFKPTLKNGHAVEWYLRTTFAFK